MKSWLINFTATSVHKWWVFVYLLKFCYALIKRGIVHDLSKYSAEEEPYFRAQVSKLKGTTFGSPEYQALLDSIRPALDHHYSVNSHHPQFYNNGIDGMSLLDEIEMLADWKAACRRHADGSIVSSVTKNAERFHYTSIKVTKYLKTIREAL